MLEKYILKFGATDEIAFGNFFGL